MVKYTGNPPRPIPSILLLFLTTYLSTKHASSLSTTIKKQNISPNEILNRRRKSPALWRNDLHPSQPLTTTITPPPIPILSNPVIPEVMSPAGGYPQLRAAVSNGADAVYIGLSAFSARARATNFHPYDDLPNVVSYCHEHSTKVYVAINTLVFSHEVQEVSELLHACQLANVDAVIVQDVGVCRIAQELGLEVHASTQQSITDGDGALFASTVGGATRVVLGRELSVDDISDVVNSLRVSDVEVEAFVHGALCVSYSGQCFSSEAWGGRSANRGQCAQACRLPYGLVNHGELIEMGDFKYLLSPQDLCGLDHVKGLMKAGVSCLKIEGRLKDASYVAATTRAYRNAVDEVWKEMYPDDDNVGKKELHLGDVDVSKSELVQLFARGQDEHHDGLSPGFFGGPKHQMLVRGRSPRHRGIHLGVVDGTRSSPKKGLVVHGKPDILSNLKRGDGIVIDKGTPQEMELGGSVFDVMYNRGEKYANLMLGGEVKKIWRDNMYLVPDGAHVWKTSDTAVDKKMRKLMDAPPPVVLSNQKQVKVSVKGKIGEPLTVCITDLNTGVIGVGVSDGALGEAENAGLGGPKLKKAIGTLGNTDYVIAGESDGIDTTELEEGLWCPISWVKEARRNAVESLLSLNKQQPSEQPHNGNISQKTVHDVLDITNRLLKQASFTQEQHSTNHDTTNKQSKGTNTMKVSVLARSMTQVETLCLMAETGHPIDEIIVDFLEVEGMKEAVSRIRQIPTTTTTPKVVVASPRIIKPDEAGIWRTLLRLSPDGLLVRSAGLLNRMTQLGGEGATITIDSQQVQIPYLIGDFSLNVANPLTAYEYLQSGLSRVTASYDLSSNAISELASCIGKPADKHHPLEVVAHAHLPIFHTEHCIFARFLSKGDSYQNCGHVCTRSNIHLRDDAGSDHLVLADMGCRNTVFSSVAQSGAHSLSQWMSEGVGRMRIELVDEGEEDVHTIVNGYLNVIDGRMNARELWEDLKLVKDSNGRMGGVGHGSFRNGVERRAGEI